MSVKPLRVLVLGGGDIGSAVAHQLFRRGVQVLISDRPASPHARRGMAFTDALFEGEASLDGVRAILVNDIAGVRACWQQGDAVPIVVLPEALVLDALQFDAIIEATMRRYQLPPDVRSLAPLVIGLGPGYVPGENCHVAIETQWGDAMGTVLRDRPAAARAGGPRPLAGVTRGRFVLAPCDGTWVSSAQLGLPVEAGDVVGKVDDQLVHAPIDGHLRGLSRDGIRVQAGHRLLEVDPREQPEIYGLGERPAAIARGVLEVLAPSGEDAAGNPG